MSSLKEENQKKASNLVVVYEDGESNFPYSGTIIEWAKEFFANIKRCSVCNKIIMPGQSVAFIENPPFIISTNPKLEDNQKKINGYVHADDYCAPLALSQGYIDYKGDIIYHFDNGKSFAESVID